MYKETSIYREQLGERLKKARIKAGYTQKQVTDLIKINQSQLSKIENGQIEPSIETLGTLIDFYEINANWLLGTGMKKTETAQKAF